MTLSIAICHVATHPERRIWVQQMVEQLGGLGEISRRLAGFDIVSDYGPEQGGGMWPNHKRSWLKGLRHGADHHLVVEDDVEFCPGFLDLALGALEAAGDRLVTFYANRKVMEEARAAGTTSWVSFRDGAWGQALVMPSRWVGEWLAWDSDNLKQDPEWWSYDSRLSLWGISNGRDWWATAPSLVEHVGAADSLIGYSNASRTARWYRGTDETPIDWSKGLEDGAGFKDHGGFMPWDPHWWTAAGGKPIWRRRQPWMDARGWRSDGS